MTALKNAMVRLFVRFLFGREDKIVIASTGRAGSTMLFDVIADSMIERRLHLRPTNPFSRAIKKICTGYVYRLNDLPDETSLICKTHDVCENAPTTGFKYIFIYGDPLDSAMSVEQMVRKFGHDWFLSHQKNLRAFGEFSELYEKDVLNYEGQLTSWLPQRSSRILCIDYDDLWSEEGRLSEFVGFSVKLPTRRTRQEKPQKSQINMALFSELRGLKNLLKREYQASLPT